MKNPVKLIKKNMNMYGELHLVASKTDKLISILRDQQDLINNLQAQLKIKHRCTEYTPIPYPESFHD